MQPGECDLHLRLNGRRRDHVTPCRAVPQILEERRLANTRLPPHYEGAALSPLKRVERSIERPAFLRTPDQWQMGIALRPVPLTGEHVGGNDEIRHAADEMRRPPDRHRPGHGAGSEGRGRVHGSATFTPGAKPRARETPGPAPRTPGVVPRADSPAVFFARCKRPPGRC